MIQINEQLNKEFSFLNYLQKNRNFLLLAAFSMIIQLVIFKHYYPYASYIHDDSFIYLISAYENLSINTYMIGYSMFLRLFSVLTTSETVLVAFQYSGIQSCALIFLYTAFYFYQPSKIIQYVLLFFFVFNPLFLYLGNLISSDPLFLSLSLLWFSTLLWIIHKPSLKLIAIHTILITTSFTVRYNAVIYPIIAITAFVISDQQLWRKMLGVGSSIICIGLFILYTGNEYKALTGTWQYSPFAGWQLANNAMYAYRYVDASERKPLPTRYSQLDNMIRTYFDSTRDVKKFPIEEIPASTFYMWDLKLPLHAYKNKVFNGDSAVPEFKKWAYMGPLYKKFGLYIIFKYPTYFIKYYLWPNANKYYSPPLEFLATYNSGKNEINTIAKNWFKHKSNHVFTRTKDNRINLLNFYPILSGIVNIIMLFGLLYCLLINRKQYKPYILNAAALIAIMWITNAGFTSFASSVALRFQAAPILISTVSVGLIVDWILNVPRTTELTSVAQCTNPILSPQTSQQT